MDLHSCSCHAPSHPQPPTCVRMFSNSSKGTASAEHRKRVLRAAGGARVVVPALNDQQRHHQPSGTQSQLGQLFTMMQRGCMYPAGIQG